MTHEMIQSSSETMKKIAQNIEKVMKGQSSAIRKLLVAFASGGHVLLEDFPGTGRLGGVLKKVRNSSSLCMFVNISYSLQHIQAGPGIHILLSVDPETTPLFFALKRFKPLKQFKPSLLPVQIEQEAPYGDYLDGPVFDLHLTAVVPRH